MRLENSLKKHPQRVDPSDPEHGILRTSAKRSSLTLLNVFQVAVHLCRIHPGAKRMQGRKQDPRQVPRF